jgi:hypothetical protein
MEQGIIYVGVDVRRDTIAAALAEVSGDRSTSRPHAAP